MRSGQEANATVLLRHLAVLAAQTNDIGAAVMRLRELAPAHLHGLVDGLESTFLAPGSKAGRFTNAWRGATPLIAQIDGVANKARALAAFGNTQRRVSPILNDIRTKLRHHFSYFLGISMTLFVVCAVFVLFVVPQFDGLFQDFGSDLPRTTATLMNLSGWVVFALVLPPGFLGMFYRSAKRAFNRLTPLARGWSRIPGFRKFTTQYNLLIYLCYVNAAHAAEKNPEAALRIASAQFGGSEDGFPGRPPMLGSPGAVETQWLSLNLARKTGNLTNEVHDLLREQPSWVFAELSGISRFLAVVKSLYAIGVGFLVTALYLPIFKMGQVV